MEGPPQKRAFEEEICAAAGKTSPRKFPQLHLRADELRAQLDLRYDCLKENWGLYIDRMLLDLPGPERTCFDNEDASHKIHLSDNFDKTMQMLNLRDKDEDNCCKAVPNHKGEDCCKPHLIKDEDCCKPHLIKDEDCCKPYLIDKDEDCCKRYLSDKDEEDRYMSNTSEKNGEDSGKSDLSDLDAENGCKTNPSEKGEENPDESKTFMMDPFDPNILQHLSEYRSRLAADLLKMDKNEWCEDHFDSFPVDEDKREAVKPHLSDITAFRDCLDHRQYQKAHGVVDKLGKEQGLKNCRKDVLGSLYRIVLRSGMEARRHSSPEEKLELSKLQSRLREELKKEHVEPATVNEAFERNDWPAMKRIFAAQKKKLSKEELNRVILMAAQRMKLQEFEECVELGADVVVGGNGQHVSEAEAPPHLDKGGIGGPTGIKRMRMTQPLGPRSPLHEAVKTGEFLLETVENVFHKNAEMVNVRDTSGDSLLHLAVVNGEPEIRMKNVKFLMKYKADVNLEDWEGKTPLQHLMHARHGPTDVDLMEEMVTRAESIQEGSWRAGDHEWSALHVLCAGGRYPLIWRFVQKGANLHTLRNGLTLIDTVILQDSLSLDLKEKTLATLLEPPVKLGPFHAKVVQKRAATTADRRNYQKFLICGKSYLYPSERLLFPLVSTRCAREAYRHFLKMLMEGGAMCQEELRSVEKSLPRVKEVHDLVAFLLPFLDMGHKC
ncbi:uncharacterized protein LOC143299775 [Babylonia areolata]|uniref:uncharacterized protein LOC143299775 n=1 Tax=Babylonia areolata TaxID=304850 RepID=UPI003FCF1D78